MQYADSARSLSVAGGARVSPLWLTVLASALLAGCGQIATRETSTPIAALACDETMKTAFKPDANTTVTLVKAFKKGDPLALAGTPASPAPQIATEDVCLVKINVGPGNPGPAGALSTSAGIGIEAWLPSPAKWNKRLLWRLHCAF